MRLYWDVAAANEAYRRYLLERGREEDHRDDVREQERGDVDRLAESLHFD